jgi:ribulose-phosphate 3-epimerase
VAVIAASILDADYSALEREVTRVAEAGVDAFSLDVMDGRFVPRLTFGDVLAARVREWVDVPIEVHLMVDDPASFVRPMADAGADMIVFHLEATGDPLEVIEEIRNEGRVPGLAVRLDTAIDDVPDDVLSAVDLVNLVAVPLGYGGSASASDTFERITQLRARIDARGLDVGIEVDGGVKPSNAPSYVEAGADMLTVGTGIYHSPDVDAAVRRLRETSAGPADERARARLRRFLARPSAEPLDDDARRARLDALRADLDVPTNVWDPRPSAR